MFFNIWVTKQCNLKCTYCYEGIHKKQDGFDTNQLENMIHFIEKQVRTEEKIWINFHGGEPLLEWNTIKKIIERLYGNKSNLFFSLTTNGVLLNDEILNYMVRNQMYLTISLDGKKDTHDKCRIDENGKGSYDKAFQSALKIKEILKYYRIRLTYTSETVGKLYENVTFLNDWEFQNIIMAPDLFDENWDKNSIDILKRQISLLRSKYKNNKNVVIPFAKTDELKRYGICKGGFNEINIDTNGDLYPCVYVTGDTKWRIGNVENGFNDRKREEIKSLYKMDNPDCIGCSGRIFCMASRCKFLNYALSGDCLRPSPVLCKMEQLKIEGIL